MCFASNYKLGGTKRLIFFSLLHSDMVFGIENPFSWKDNAIPSEKNRLIPMPFLFTYMDVRIVKLNPPACWILNSARQPEKARLINNEQTNKQANKQIISPVKWSYPLAFHSNKLNNDFWKICTSKGINVLFCSVPLMKIILKSAYHRPVGKGGRVRGVRTNPLWRSIMEDWRHKLLILSF